MFLIKRYGSKQIFRVSAFFEVHYLIAENGGFIFVERNEQA
jgi:hypothetical protein